MGKIDGIERLTKKLAALDKKTRNQVVRKSLRDGAKTLAAEVKGRAPVESGLLRKSVKVRAAKRKKDRITLRVVVSGGHPTPMVGSVELGDRDEAARPFIRPAFDARGDQVRDTALNAIARGIEEAAR